MAANRRSTRSPWEFITAISIVIFPSIIAPERLHPSLLLRNALHMQRVTPYGGCNGRVCGTNEDDACTSPTTGLARITPRRARCALGGRAIGLRRRLQS